MLFTCSVTIPGSSCMARLYREDSWWHDPFCPVLLSFHCHVLTLLGFLGTAWEFVQSLDPNQAQSSIGCHVRWHGTKTWTSGRSQGGHFQLQASSVDRCTRTFYWIIGMASHFRQVNKLQRHWDAIPTTPYVQSQLEITKITTICW